MLNFIKAGGVPMWFVIFTGTVGLVASARFAFKANERMLGAIRAMTWSTVFAILAAITSDLTAVMWKVPQAFGDSPDLKLVVMQGIGEALTPAILGFSMLTLSWLLVAVGARRLSDPKD